MIDTVKSIFYKWIDDYINPVTSLNSLGDCTFTNNSLTVTGTSLTGKISDGGWIKSLTDNIWVKVASYTSTSITLTLPYPGTSHHNTTYTLPTIIPVIYSKQNSPLPNGKVIIIHKPNPITSIGGNVNGYTNNSGVMTYSTRYQGTLTIEIIESEGGEFLTLLDTLKKQIVMDYFRDNFLSILRNTGITQIDFNDGEDWVDRVSMDFIFLYTTTGTISEGYIGTVDFTGDYNN